MNMMKNSKVQVTIGDNSQFEFTYEGKTWKTNIEFEPIWKFVKRINMRNIYFLKLEKLIQPIIRPDLVRGIKPFIHASHLTKNFLLQHRLK